MQCYKRIEKCDKKKNYRRLWKCIIEANKISLWVKAFRKESGCIAGDGKESVYNAGDSGLILG